MREDDDGTITSTADFRGDAATRAIGRKDARRKTKPTATLGGEAAKSMYVPFRCAERQVLLLKLCCYVLDFGAVVSPSAVVGRRTRRCKVPE